MKTRNRKSQATPMGMKELAREVGDFHRRTFPEARHPLPHPFAARIVRGLWLGIALGLLIGLAFGILLHQGTIPGWERLYSLGAFTFYVLWAMLGVAAGIIIGGVGGMIVGSG